MARREYPRSSYKKIKKYKGLRGLCHKCGGQTKRGEWIILKTEQINWFRGDDNVYLYHLECDPRKKEKGSNE